MKNGINKSAKRALSFALSFIMLIGTLFVANVGINVSAQDNGVVYWSGEYDNSLAGSGTAEDPYLITNAEELAALAGGKLNITKHYKVSGVSKFYMFQEKNNWIIDVLDYSNVSEVKSVLTDDSVPAWPSSQTFEGVLDGNGATIYGLSAKGVTNAGLFASLKGGTVKNFTVEKSYFSATNNAGAISAQGNWNLPDESTYSPTNTITGCVVRDCYIEANGSRGGLLGNGGYSGIVVDSCLVADNFIGAKDGAADGYPTFISGSDPTTKFGVEVPTVISNSIGIGAIPKAGDVKTYTYKEIKNCFTTINVTYTGSHITMTYASTAASLKGRSAKITAGTLNWATDTANGAGYWHVSATDYPSPIKPEGWSDIIVHSIWNGTAADSYAAGTGTAEDPYIIETAEQLYKMAISGGRELTGKTKTVKLTVGVTDASGNMLDKNGNITTDTTAQAYEYSDETVEVPEYRQCYYKVADGVTDIYLNDVEGGTLDTLKSLVSSGKAIAWNKNYNGKTEKTDNDGDGFWDENSAFRGVFDGNGVTIHGLYSAQAVNTDWLTYGDGFLPAIKGNAVVKNVTFDKSYINPKSGYGAVVSSSIGLDSANNNPEKNSNKGVLGDGCVSTKATFANIAIRNTYIAQGGWSEQGGVVGAYNKAGILSAHGTPGSLSFVNCLYDGTNSTLEYNTNDHTAGIYMTANTASNATFVNCVSIGLQPLACSLQSSAAKFINCYTTVAKNNFHSINSNDDVIVISEYDSQDDLPLLNWGVWSVKTVENGRKLPMPGISNVVITGYASIKKMVLDNVFGAGNFNYIGAQLDGKYGQYHKLIGAGTEEDPYLINNAQELATAISTGGVNVSNRLYYKLTCDINLGSLAWIDTETVEQADGYYYHYIYVPFEGVLDGAGHTIYELNATAENSGALIPELNGGTVKNLHIRNSAANAAIIAKGTGTVENCSALNCYVAADDKAIVSGDITVTNSMINDTYYLADGTSGMPTLDGVTWYGIAGKAPHLVSNAQTMPCADIDGDGIGDSYNATDLVALKNILLKKQDYKFAYGDANKDGKVNSGDLVILVRALADDYNHVKDGFWRNVELGNFTIYYGENDNYDAARKLELYLESVVEGLDIVKAVSGSKVVSGEQSDKTAVYRHANDIEATPDGKLDIIVGNVGDYTTALTDNDYGITYDYENGVLWIQGANFTGVEQAVIDFVNNSNRNSSIVYTVDCDTLEEEKWPVTINGTTYYYAWGDEFDGVNGTVNEDKWEYTHNITETVNMEVYGKADGDKYMDMEIAFNADMYKLFTVDDGKLTMRRGVYLTDDVKNVDYSWGWVGLDIPSALLESDDLCAKNELGGQVSLGSAETGKDIYVESGKIITQHSLLAKQGYFELMASLPSDGHSFPAWWMMGSASGGNNNAYSESLFGKVYKYNPNYKGRNALDPANFTDTYRYQLPNAYFEIDIIELMQDISVLSSSYQNTQLTGIYDYNLTTNIHKYYDTYASGNTCYIVNWDNGSSTTVSMSQFDTGSSPDWIASARANDHYFVTGIYNDRRYQAYGQKRLTTMRRYGFEWKVENGQYEFTLYIYNSEPDNNTANGVKDERIVFASNSNSIDYNETGGNKVKDIDVANQYLYFLIDNKYYTANQLYGRTDKTTLFTDLLTKDDDKDEKTTFEIDYMRVYQADGRRDIVTPETESFNNGNHFGY